MPDWLTRTAFHFTLALGLLGSVPRAGGQWDFPEAQEARRVLGSLQPSQRARLENWWSPLGSTADELRRELFRGDAADAETIKRACELVLNQQGEAGAAGQWIDELLDALNDVVRELDLPAPEQWEQLCRELEHAASVNDDLKQPVEADRLRRGSAELMEPLARRYKELAEPNQKWHRYLRWSETRSLLKGEATEDLDLDGLELRWSNVPTLWDDFEMLELASLVLSTIRQTRAVELLKVGSHPELSWCELADLLSDEGWAKESTWTRLVNGMIEHERHGDVNPVTRAVRRVANSPTWRLTIERPAFDGWFPAPVSESFPVDGSFGGSPTRGTSDWTGTLDIEFLPAPLAAKWLFRLQGTSQADTVSYDQRVRVFARSTTNIQGSAENALSVGGILADPPQVTAQSRVAFRGVTGPHTRLGEHITRRRVQQRRGWAERDTETATRDQVKQTFTDFQRSLDTPRDQLAQSVLCQNLLATDRLVPEIRLSSSAENLTALGHLAGPMPGRLPQPLPEKSQSTGIQISVAESAVEAYLAAIWGNKSRDGEQLVEDFSGLFTQPKDASNPDNPPIGDLSLTFGKRPVEVRLQAGKVEAVLHCSQLRLGGTEYPPLQVRVAYRPSLKGDKWNWTREGRPEVELKSSSGNGEGISGRQQTLRLVVERRLARLLPEQVTLETPRFVWQAFRDLEVRVVAEEIEGGWWQWNLAASRTK